MQKSLIKTVILFEPDDAIQGILASIPSDRGEQPPGKHAGGLHCWNGKATLVLLTLVLLKKWAILEQYTIRSTPGMFCRVFCCIFCTVTFLQAEQVKQAQVRYAVN